MDVYWLEQTEADVPASDQWLSASELARMRNLRFAKRRAEWRLGRWTAKRALAACLDLPGFPQSFAALEIIPAPSGAPQALLNNEPLGMPISLSHRKGRAICAIAAFEAEIGCDLELVEPLSDIFVADYFTAEERAFVAETPRTLQPLVTTLLWSSKESALKALHEGLRLDTRSVNIRLAPRSTELSETASSWGVLRVHSPGGRMLHGWWRHKGDFVRTLVAHPEPGDPILLVPAPCDPVLSVFPQIAVS